jgi:hypothetical protein
MMNRGDGRQRQAAAVSHCMLFVVPSPELLLHSSALPLVETSRSSVVQRVRTRRDAPLVVVVGARSRSSSSGSSAAPFQLAALAPGLCGGVEADGHTAASTPGHGVARGPRGRRRPVASAMSVTVRRRRHRPPCSSHAVDDGEVQKQDGDEAQRGGGPRPP